MTTNHLKLITAIIITMVTTIIEIVEAVEDFKTGTKK
jgi:hypothetical protein